MAYTGYKDLVCSEEDFNQLYTNKTLSLDNPARFIENEYLIARDATGQIIDYFTSVNGEIIQVGYQTLDSKWCGSIKPRNPEQRIAFDMLKDERSKVKLLRGVYGSGKDISQLTYAMSQIESGKYQKIAFIRPNVSVANVPEIGYLKGSEYEKLGWTLGPFYDKLGGQEGVEGLITAGQLELVPLLFIRGRSFDNTIMYICEAQNITSEIAKLILSRCGENSIILLNADNHQVDNRVFEKDNGITKMIDRLKGNPLFSYVYLPTTERGAVANLANLLDDPIE